MSNRKQRVVLNGKYSSWTSIEAGVTQHSILGPLFFLIYINGLSDNLITNPKLLADNTSLFFIVHDPNATANDVNNDLAKINAWAYQWKMNFNPYPFKQAQEFLFFQNKTKSQNHPCLHFNNNPVNQAPLQKHLGMYLDLKLDFLEHLKNIQAKVNKSTALLRKLQAILPRPILTIYKAFLRPHLDYGDTIYDQAYNDSFHQKLKSIQYNATLAMTGAIRATSLEKLYQELGLESLQQRHWHRKLCTFLKIVKEKSPDYFFNIIPKNNSNHRTRNSYNIPQFNIKHNFFKNSFFPSVIAEWNKLDSDIQI